ncbi:Uracil phosphoribosyltransferase [Elusimicrobium minutum Pei191]|uniref:Bifunctional protein PyrR n=1 Tax=Elusimicrobium minutum (strain Pei191) TaxID=445932 RepID=PYRR_ELUMP|nr:bifunctional pyr operon transcriptional regulator/uracil phosphoribosyltransferase PyrR [Elusimicrobium minutum]B2KCN3.1 RecName: Full=Bifunctional protein PyrR; Includes: RecName: Full=Pyrimidine operon regulatory protein; Includes: RecName: Full=Uracil phosphoribosyltransferase; Short=UPRTase [Elusimicrobium minutum Pei191]ACC98279.1 Uracil phosphoribosyltransferase [Elusimicrobium minutum Pei191]
MEKLIKDGEELNRTLDRMAHEILEKHEIDNTLALVGIRTRGIYIARRLMEKIKKITGKDVLYGELDITLYRDDLSQVAEQPVLKATNIPFDITGKTIILTDDVLYTGRTIRSALAALSDFGRPSRIELAVIVDRGHRELPIKADYVGKNLPTAKTEIVHIKLKEYDGEDSITLLVKNND